MTTLTDPDAVRAALADPPTYRMPAVDARATGGIAWLRAAVARFRDGPVHARRRGYAVELLAAVAPDDLRRQARARTAAVLAGATAPVEVMTAIARPVPVGVLAAALGVDPDPTADVTTVARAYQPAHGGGPAAEAAADAAVAALVAACGGTTDEPTAARIGLLVQACDATAGLVGAAILAGSVTAALRDDPPVRLTRRIRAGAEVRLDLTSTPFGAGPHECPGRGHAGAIANGVLDALRGWHVVPGTVMYEPGPALRIPARLVVARQPSSLS